MTYDPSDMIVREPIGVRRYARSVDLPLDVRLKTRLGRALLNGLAKPVRSIPTTRRAVLAVRQVLNAQGFSDGDIRTALEKLTEEIAFQHGIDTISLASGATRRDQLNARIADWIACTAENLPGPLGA